MADAPPSAAANPPPVGTGAPSVHAQIDALRARGAERFDPIGLRFIVTLADRAASHGGAARRVLDHRLDRALAEYGERLDLAEREARDALEGGTLRFPESAGSLQQHFEAADFHRLHRRLAQLDTHSGRGPLSALLAYIARHAAQADSDGGVTDTGIAAEPRDELKALRYFRSTWSRLSVDRQLSRAFAQAPENAGPLNSHFLVLQALRAMRDISPEYVEQFVAYVDALLWLEQGEGSPAQKNAARSQRGAKRKPARRKAG